MCGKMSLIQKIANQTYKTISCIGGKNSYFCDNIKLLTDLLKKLTVKELNIESSLLQEQPTYRKNDRVAPVTYIDLWNDECFTMGVFILKPGTRLPLHDHPEMHGIIKVIHGTCLINSYSVHQENSDKPIQKLRKPLLKIIKNIETKVDPLADPVVLTPDAENCHEIRAPDGVMAFFDILFPPYDEENRQCNYYKLHHDQIEGSRYLLKIPPPTEYWTDSVKYAGPAIDEESVYKSC